MVQRHGAPAQFPFHQRKLQVAQPRTANAFRKVAGVEAQLDSLAFDLFRDLDGHLTRAFNQFLMWIDFIFYKGSNRRNDHLLLFIQPILHGVLVPFCQPLFAGRLVYICVLCALVLVVAAAVPSWNVPNHLSNGISEVP